MATVQEPKAGRADAYVGDQIDRARRRIQAQDVGIASLGLIGGTLAYALGMVVLDRWLHLPDVARQVALLVYLAAAAAYAGLVLTRPLRREVNPYFAARRVERSVPGAKNSVVSWLDLHDEPLPASIRSAVSQKAAADLKRADLDEVVRDRRLPLLGGFAGGLFVAALVLFFLLRPNQFLSLLGRTFAPFGSGAIATRTTFDVLQPAGGDVTVPVNTPVDVRVAVLGRVPDPAAADAVRLRLRYNPADPVWEEIPLNPSPRDPREFAVRVPSNRVQAGFVYRVVGGDAVTPEHRVSVRSSPLIEGFEVVYHFRPYLRFRDQTAANPNIEGLRGTEVTLTARTNRTVRDGVLKFEPVRDGQKLPPPLTATAVPDQPAALRFKFVLDEDARYTITFHSVEGERNEGSIPYTIKVLGDHPPQVDVTHPAPDTLPVNGTITVEGKASDDYGLTAMRLALRLPGEPATLAPKVYRPGKSFKFDDGTYPRALDYKDFLPLDQLKTTIGATVPVKAGTVIEYWLEAEDNSDNPKPNVGKSKVYRVTLAEPQPQEEKQGGEKQAADGKAEHDKKQDQDLAQENEAKKQEGEKGDAGKPDGTPQQGDKPEGDQKADAKDEAVEKQARDLQDKLDNARQQDGKGEAKDNPSPPAGEQPMNPAEQKGDKPDGNPQGTPPNQPDQSKGDGKGDPKSAQPQPGDDKGEGKADNQPSPQAEPGEAKDMNPGQPQPDQKQPMPGENPGQPDNKQPSGAPGEKPDQPKGQQPNPGEAKQSPQDGQQNAGEKKEQPQGDAQPGECKGCDKGQKPGDSNSRSDGTPSTGGPQGGNPQDNKPGQPGTPPKPGANEPNNPKGTDANRTPSENPPKSPDDKDTPPKPEAGKGGQPGQKDRSGERPGTGPKKDPLDKDPMGQPDPNDPGRDGQGSKTGSGQPGGTPPKGAKPEDAPDGQGEGGTPEMGEAKPRSSPADSTDKGQGKPAGEGELKDAPKPHDQPGGATATQPKTEGTPADGKPTGTPKGQPAGRDPKDGANGRSELQKLADDLKSGDPQRQKAAEERIKELMKEAGNDPQARQAIEEAMKRQGEGNASGSKPGEGKPDPSGAKSPDQGGKGTKPGDNPGEPMGSTPKPGPDGKPGPGDTGTKPGQPTDPKGQPGQPGATKGQPGEGDMPPGKPGDAPPSDDPATPNARRDGQGVPGTNPPGSDPTATPPTRAEKGTAPDAKHASKSGDLQLERFPKDPSKELLQDLGMTAEQYRQFLKDAAALQKKRDAEARDNRLRGDGTGRSAANTGAKRVDTTGDKKEKLEQGGATPPPPEYRDGYKGFTEDVSKPAGGAKKE